MSEKVKPLDFCPSEQLLTGFDNLCTQGCVKNRDDRNIKTKKNIFTTGSIGQRSSGRILFQKLPFNGKKKLPASFVKTVLFFPKEKKTQKFLGKGFRAN